jgi:hypothetical protein
MNGFVLLTSMFVVSAVGLAISVSLLLLGTGASRSGLVLQQGKEAAGLADTCAEEALERIRNDSAYTGTQIITRGNGSCEYAIITGAGEERTIESIGTVDTVIHNVQVHINQINPRINITSWQEVGDF